MSNSVAEAMSLGIATIGSNVGGMRELIGNDDCIFEPGDNEKLTDLLLRLCLSESLRVAIGETARSRILITHSVREMVNNTWGILEAQ